MITFLHGAAGSVLDFSSLRQRDSEDQQLQQEALAAQLLNKGCPPVPIKTISGTLTPLPPLLQLTECEGLPIRGYNFSARKPSQDSGWWWWLMVWLLPHTHTAKNNKQTNKKANT